MMNIMPLTLKPSRKGSEVGNGLWDGKKAEGSHSYTFDLDNTNVTLNTDKCLTMLLDYKVLD